MLSPFWSCLDLFIHKWKVVEGGRGFIRDENICSVGWGWAGVIGVKNSRCRSFYCWSQSTDEKCDDFTLETETQVGFQPVVFLIPNTVGSSVSFFFCPGKHVKALSHSQWWFGVQWAEVMRFAAHAVSSSVNISSQRAHCMETGGKRSDYYCEYGLFVFLSVMTVILMFMCVHENDPQRISSNRDWKTV